MKRTTAVMVLLLVVALVVPAGCGGGQQQASTPSIYSLTAAGGTMSRMGDGSRKLELTGVSTITTRYAMRPNREAYRDPTARLVKGWGQTFGNGQATGALSLDASAGDEAAVMTLSDPVYGSGAGNLTFRVTDSPTDGGRNSWEGKPASQVPAQFANATLFLDRPAGKAPSTPIFVREGAVSISFRGPYYYVDMDMTRGVSRYRIGQQYAKAIRRINPDAEFRISTYISSMIWVLAMDYGVTGKELLARADEIKRSLPREYTEEIDGLASGMKSYFPLSASSLMYLCNLLPDVFRWTACSAFGTWGASSSTGSNVVYRTLDWYEGLLDEMTEIQAVTRYHFADRDVHMIGGLGFLGCLTGISTTDPQGPNGTMGAIMDANVSGSKYSAKGCRSYNFDLRYALEHLNSKEEIARFMADKPYTFSNVILLADSAGTVVLENNVSNMGEAPSHAVRDDVSPLNPGIAWGYPQMLGAVNGFCLRGQVNNFSKGINGEINTERWALMREKIDELRKAGGGSRLTPDDVKKMMTSYRGRAPGSLEEDEGDLYNQQSQQMALYLPAEGFLEVFFKPLDGSTPKVPTFTTIPLKRAL
ncbi:MAG: C45 family autoproteolytic acyltransferase/hydrolase [Candidatus Geothermincolia bacterium]